MANPDPGRQVADFSGQTNRGWTNVAVKKPHQSVQPTTLFLSSRPVSVYGLFIPFPSPRPKQAAQPFWRRRKRRKENLHFLGCRGFCDTHSTPLTHSHAASCQGEKRSVATLHKYHGNSPRPLALSSSLPILGGSHWRILPLYHLICLCQRGEPRPSSPARRWTPEATGARHAPHSLSP